ncbi:aminotransferase class I/II-fold pyridoxal phosphate-dependent enzyme [Pseudomonas moraviensis subsp. stanleyae]|uniref:aminotransferase class I/II-fold pyridoxal phosphate-dependent enzyme n=1 Tax=Pseudomonas moraviensis TaxID=321662 RepID=UPI002E34E288|nr:aminotransferase class I/II-fold pyridoxal phosphate-dependent enzyme [Pseudomonas moraviensis]MED7670656.1 aminotransferase class I/II-fold pyridoxal phosphate-dependent enzyme [Pseudomonas moraviensis subsp. stanleyae]
MTNQTAIILCAGRGSRLGKRTRHTPKPLVKTNNIAFIDNALNNLETLGITNVVVVVGYQSETITAHLRAMDTTLTFEFVSNPDWATTNNIYSLYLAREHIAPNTLIIEGDIYFSASSLQQLLQKSGDLIALVSPLDKNMEGTYAVLDGEHLQGFGSTKDVGHQAQDGQFKTVNLYQVGTATFAEHIKTQLANNVRNDNLNAYYEDVFKKASLEGKWDIQTVIVPTTEWYEVDNHYDLTVCNYISSSDRLDFVQNRHGGYWRYPMLDFALIYNFHFPPQQMKDKIKENFDHILLNYPGGRKLMEESLSEFLGVSARHLCIANGAAEIIKLLPAVYSGSALVTVPSFNEYANVFGEQRTLCHYTREQDDFAIDIDALLATCRQQRPDVVIIESPNNPTGALTPASALASLAADLLELDISLIVDESFLDFSSHASSTLLNVLDEHPNLVVIRSMSKTFGIGGIRIGYLASANRTLMALINSLLPIWNINGFAEEFLLHLPQYQQQYLASCQQVISDTRAFQQALNAIDGISSFETEANFIYCKTHHGDAQTISRLLLDKHHIYIKECSGKRNDDSDKYFRISCRTPDENARLIHALTCVMQDLASKQNTSNQAKESAVELA